MTFEMKVPGVESILTPQEKEMFKNFKIKNQDMTEEGYLELRKKALEIRDPHAKAFAVYNGLITDDKNPDADVRRELAGKN